MKKDKGLTLVALVITIIVLLILAGVALATVTGNDSILENANKAVNKYEQQLPEDEKLLERIEEMFQEYMG